MDSKQKLKLIAAVVLFVVAGFVIWFLNFRKPDAVVIKPAAGSQQAPQPTGDATKPGANKPQADLAAPATQNADRPRSPIRVAPPGGG
jgi:flagellar basal body-associated protein FliL